MKINQLGNSNTINRKRQDFNGLGNVMVGVNDAILKAGFAATFVAQDFLGSEMPRILTGLTRNSDKIGHLNYQFAAMEAARELLTGPPVFMLPFAAFALAQKMTGGTVKTPVKMIEAFSDKASNVCAKEIKNAEQFKKAFYSSAWNDALKNTCGTDYTPTKGVLKRVTHLMSELETSKKYTLSDRFKKVPKFRTTKDIMGDIVSVIQNEIRSNADAKGSFTRVAFKDGVGKTAQASIGTFAERMNAYAKDSLKHLGDDLTNTSKAFEKIASFKKKKIGNRVLANFAILATAILYVTQVPKIYKSINKTNPGLIGLTDEAAKPKNVIDKTPVNYMAFNELKKAKNQPSFKGLNRIAQVVMKDGTIRKIAGAFEFDSGNMSFWALMSTLGLGILRPRVKNAYDKHDKREILTRDIATLTALVAGAKALQKTIARVFEKATGFVLTEKAENYAKQSKLKRIFDHIRPFGGVQLHANDDIVLKYSNIEKFKGGIAGFCEYISKTGGNLVKFFANDKTTKENVERMLGKKLDASTQEEIISAFSNKNNSQYIKNIVKVFKKPDNAFVKKAKSVTGIFGFMSTFVAVPAFMIFLQKFNEKMTKHLLAKEKEEKKNVEQKFTALKLTTDMILPEKSALNLK